MDSNQNVAYDFSLFEPREERAPRRKPKKTRVRVLPAVKRKGISTAAVARVVAGSIAAVSMMFLIMVGNVRLAEIDGDISTMQTKLNNAKSEYVSLQVKLESRMSLNKVENYAVNTLGLSKIQNYQITYINVNAGDKVEIDPRNQNVIQRTFAKIVGIVKSYFS